MDGAVNFPLDCSIERVQMTLQGERFSFNFNAMVALLVIAQYHAKLILKI
jgi:hypothetical protein